MNNLEKEVKDLQKKYSKAFTCDTDDWEETWEQYDDELTKRKIKLVAAEDWPDGFAGTHADYPKTGTYEIFVCKDGNIYWRKI